MIGIASAIVILIVAMLFYTSVIGNAPKQVVVIIPEGAGENLHIGFDPAKITIVIGVNNTVVWKNEDNDWHTAHSNIPEFNSGLIESGASFTHVFERAGIFPYHCDPHPWMTGLVIVESSSSMGIIQPSINSSIGTIFAALDRILESI
jgi:plastocyanin